MDEKVINNSKLHKKRNFQASSSDIKIYVTKALNAYISSLYLYHNLYINEQKGKFTNKNTVVCYTY